MPRFHIQLGDKHHPRLSFEVTAPDGETAHNQAADLRESVHERMEVVAVHDEAFYGEADDAWERERKAREQRRIAETVALEQSYHQRAGWLV